MATVIKCDRCGDVAPYSNIPARVAIILGDSSPQWNDLCSGCRDEYNWWFRTVARAADE